jgi:hypothetical protein
MRRPSIICGRPCRLAATDAAFHATELRYWWRRLAALDGPAPDLRGRQAVIAATGVLIGKTRRAVDSTVLDDAVATHATVTT